MLFERVHQVAFRLLEYGGRRVMLLGRAFTVPPLLMEPPEVKYAKSGTVRIAYQLLGSGPVDLLLARSGVYRL